MRSVVNPSRCDLWMSTVYACLLLRARSAQTAIDLSYSTGSIDVADVYASINMLGH